MDTGGHGHQISAWRQDCLKLPSPTEYGLAANPKLRILPEIRRNEISESCSSPRSTRPK
jgi:hypothetical protein